jgi:hypothetical protein
LEHGGKFEADRPAAKPVKMNAAPAPTPAPAASAPDPKSGKPGDSFMIEVASLEWTPKPDGKVEVKIFGPGRKYPDLYWNTTVKQAIVGLQAADVHLTEEDLRFAKTMSVNMYAHYVLSEKLSASGKPYKNLVQLSADPFPVSE